MQSAAARLALLPEDQRGVLLAGLSAEELTALDNAWPF
jgi:hypothetical protein